MPTSATPTLPSTLDDYQRMWNAAGNPWNSDALAACFTEDGLFFGGRPQHSVGRAAILEYFRSYIGVIASCTLSLRDQQVLEVAPDYFVSQGFGDFSFVLGDGSHTRSSVRTTLMLVRKPEGWRARMQNFAPSPAEPPLGRNG